MISKKTFIFERVPLEISCISEQVWKQSVHSELYRYKCYDRGDRDNIQMQNSSHARSQSVRNQSLSTGSSFS